jgi:hypothetical protein
MVVRWTILVAALALALLLVSTNGIVSKTTLASAPAAAAPYTGTYHVAEEGIVVDGLEVHGNIVIEARNVTMTHIKLVSGTPWHALQVMEKATGFTLRDSEIDGRGTTVNGVLGFGRYLHNDIHDVENGINVTGPTDIRDNFIHDLQGGKDAHFDGIEINGADHITIVDNTIVNPHAQTSAIMLDNYFTGLSEILVDGNRLIGGGYALYIDGRFTGGPVDNASIKIVNNKIGGSVWGNFALFGNTPVLSGNVDLGRNVPADMLRKQ